MEFHVYAFCLLSANAIHSSFYTSMFSHHIKLCGFGVNILRFFLMVFDLLVVIDLQLFGKHILDVMEDKSDNTTRYFKGE